MRSPRQKTFRRLDDRSLASRICEGYQPTDGCPPLSTHWGGPPLSGSPWLTKFAELVATNSATAEAWRMLEKELRKDDLCVLIELLYLCTVTGYTYVEKSSNSHRVLKAALDSIIPVYDDLIEKLSELVRSSDAKDALTYESFDDDLRLLAAGRTHSEKVRRKAAFYATKKTNSRDWYLHMMVVEMERGTRTHQIPTLIDLLDIAWKANGVEAVLLDEGTLRRRVLRIRKRSGLDKAPPLPSHLFDRKEEGDPADPDELRDLQEYYDSQESTDSHGLADSESPSEDEGIPF